MIELFSKLESEKDKWIYQAIDVFAAGFLQRQELLVDLDTDQTAENQMIQMKNQVHTLSRQKNQELEAMKKVIRQLSETLNDDEKSYENNEKDLFYLRADLTLLTDNLHRLDDLQMEKFDYRVEDHFGFEKGKVIFKDRKTDKLIDTYRLLELAMLQHYEKQMRQLVKTLETVMDNLDRNLDFETTPSIIGLALNHGRLSNQYLLYRNFEEDFSIVEETLEDNHKTIHQYYQQQIQHMVKQGKQAYNNLLESKQSDYRVAEEAMEAKNQKLDMNRLEMKGLQEKLDQAIGEWDLILNCSRQLEEILKEEFVKAVTALQTPLLSPEVSDSEKWAYHQYSQILLKQAERIIGNDDI